MAQVNMSLVNGEYGLVITEPEATICFSINFLVNIMSLSRCLHQGVNMIFASDKTRFCKI